MHLPHDDLIRSERVVEVTFTRKDVGGPGCVPDSRLLSVQSGSDAHQACCTVASAGLFAFGSIGRQPLC
jgi:hypothetical protein